MLIAAIAIALPFACTVVMFYALPSLARRDQFLGVTVRPSFRQSPDAHRIVRLYRLQVLLHAALGLAGVAVALVRNAYVWLPAALLWPAVGSILAVALGHRSALRHAVSASGIRGASLQPRPRSWPGGPVAWVGPFAILALAALYVGLHWGDIPARFPVHWGIDGQPNGWRVRSPMGVFKPILISAAFWLVNVAMVRELIGSSRGSAAVRRMSVLLVLLVVYGNAVFAALRVGGLAFDRSSPHPGMSIIVTAVTLAAVLVSVVVALRARRIEASSAASSEAGRGTDVPIGDNSDDGRWIGGVLYFNPDDPAVFVEKRVGLGYGLNFGNPRAWVLFGAVLLIPVAVVLLR